MPAPSTQAAASDLPTTRRAPKRTSFSEAAARAAQRLHLDRQLRFWVHELSPLSTPDRMLARVTGIHDETHDTKTFTLRAGRGWQGHTPGQFTNVDVEIDGVRQTRCYSVSSAPSSRHLSITVKRVSGGLVSNWLHDHLQVGDIIGISPADGDFVLPDDAATLLFIAAGSGITPMLSMARDLAARGAFEDTVMVYYARSADDLIAGDELSRIAAEHSGFRYVAIRDDAHDGTGGFDEARLRDMVPDLFDRAAFTCGPAGLMDRVEAMWRDAGVESRLQRERFTLPTLTDAGGDPNVERSVVLTSSGRTAEVTGGETILAGLERAGEKPAHGCRMGICKMCRCRKVSGSVRNVVTGEISDAPDQDIQICISAANSDLALAL